MDVSDLASLIRRRRLELRLTQREAAQRAGVSLATWQSLERHRTDDRAFQELTLARAADGLGLPDAEVFAAAGQPTDTAPPPPASRVTDGTSGSVVRLTDSQQDDDGATSAAELLEHLTALLLALAERSEADFMLVYGQALEAADHLLARHRPAGGSLTDLGPTGRPSGRSS